MENKDGEQKLLYIDHKGEALIWLIIICLFVGVFTLLKINKPARENEYNIFMPDVDGLIVGSPVRMMGIEVGHIIKIEPIKDEVFVKFVITEKEIKIPQGTQATVEFSGMAGSKSLELYLPDEKTYISSEVPLLSVNPPKRLSDAFGLLNEMFRKVGSMITISSRFGRKLNEIELPKTKEDGNINEFIKYANDSLDESQKRMEDLGRRLEHYGKRKK